MSRTASGHRSAPKWPSVGTHDAELTRRLRDLVAQIDAPDPHTLADALDRWLHDHVRAGALKAPTLSAYRRTVPELRERWGDLPITTDWAREAADLVALRGRSAQPYLGVLRQVLIHARRLGWRHESHGLRELIRRCDYAPRESAYSADEIARLLVSLDELDRTDPGRHLQQVVRSAREVIRVLAYTGCRLMEIASLRREDVRGGQLRLRDSKVGPRTVPIPGPAQLVIGRQTPRGGWVFPGRGARHVSATAVQVRFAQARDHAGLPAGSVHTLRHSWATIAIRRGVPSEAVQTVLGHCSAYMTSRYIHLGRRDGALAAAAVAAAIDEEVRR